jgi:hypothetical protein
VAVLPLTALSGIVTRSPDEVVVREWGHIAWSEGGNDDPSE